MCINVLFIQLEQLRLQQNNQLNDADQDQVNQQVSLEHIFIGRNMQAATVFKPQWRVFPGGGGEGTDIEKGYGDVQP